MAPPLRILLIGSGGREHALAWKLSQSARVEHIFVAPGNGGTATCAKATNVDSVAADDFGALVAFAGAHGVNLVVPGPEAPLVAGVEAFFRAAGIACFGPSREAARLEGSKTYAKDFMRRHGIPTAAYRNFSDYDEAVAYVDAVGHDVVIKATGLAAGKGVVLPRSRDEARDALRRIMVDGEFGAAGDEVVVEELLLGDELSVLTFCDGYTMKSLPLAQDHKRVGDGDQGPNTGGMGCYAPTNIATRELVETIERDILEPTFAGMRRERQPFRGVLFTGLMVTSAGPKVLEYNVRFGDPETQTLLPLLSRDTDLADVMLACAEGYLDGCHVGVDDGFSATVVVAAAGYPGTYVKGTPMTVGEPAAGGGATTTVFHAGTRLDGGRLTTAGGRVAAVNCVAPSLRGAVDGCYGALSAGAVGFDGIFFRRDIAHRAFRDAAPREGLTYAQAGVDIQAGNDFVDSIRAAVASTRRPGADAEIGGFGGELDLSRCAFPGAPVLVGAIDGVGTKLLIAQAAGEHAGVGVDLVAMNVNDLVVQGATPLMFLDYYGCGRLRPAAAAAFVRGVADGCRQAGCALVGGETAEMPGMYRGDDYDAAGCAVGAVAPADRLPRRAAMAAGDVLLGLASRGLHSNGFSLVRRVLARAGLALDAPAPWQPEAGSVAAALLAPTRIYVRALLPSLRRLKGLAHVTGGGLLENVPRMLPARLAAELDLAAWEVPPVFRWLRRAGAVDPLEMCRTFNVGVGMVAAVAAEDADEVARALAAEGDAVFRIGRLVERAEGEPACVIRNLVTWE